MAVRNQLAVLLALLSGMAWGNDEAALLLADQTEMEAETPKELKLQVEAAAAVTDGESNQQRVSLDLRWEARLGGGGHAVLANRLDGYFNHALKSRSGINTLKEAYLGRRLASNVLLDAGRINTRYGVALAYNPTDFLGEGTLRSIVSADPESLRNNRLGNVMLRGQKLWDEASLTAIWSPKLASSRSSNGASPDWGASNPRQRLLLAASYRFSEQFNPQALLLQEQGRPWQLGLNLSRVLNNATVGYLEWAGGHQAWAWQRDLPAAQQQRSWRNRTAYGLTWTHASKLSLTVEGQYDAAAPNAEQWCALQASPFYWQYRQNSLQTQSLPSRRAGLLRVSQQDFMRDNLDLVVMRQQNLVDHSSMDWAEARYRFKKADVALQWQHFGGSKTSTYGGSPYRQKWQFLVSYYV
ncbi:hypothetical protein HZU77_004765 [Neisseriaceae bacterium TC5R-5]|nr:hypothetical protein [Neisseriaceae bacterium TC5R-5]